MCQLTAVPLNIGHFCHNPCGCCVCHTLCKSDYPWKLLNRIQLNFPSFCKPTELCNCYLNFLSESIYPFFKSKYRSLQSLFLLSTHIFFRRLKNLVSNFKDLLLILDQTEIFYNVRLFVCTCTCIWYMVSINVLVFFGLLIFILHQGNNFK